MKPWRNATLGWRPIPEGPNTQYFNFLVLKPYHLWFVGPGSLNFGYVDPLGIDKTCGLRLKSVILEIRKWELYGPEAPGNPSLASFHTVLNPFGRGCQSEARWKLCDLRGNQEANSGMHEDRGGDLCCYPAPTVLSFSTVSRKNSHTHRNEVNMSVLT